MTEDVSSALVIGQVSSYYQFKRLLLMRDLYTQRQLLYHPKLELSRTYAHKSNHLLVL
jgi:hypothetical protein